MEQFEYVYMVAMYHSMNAAAHHLHVSQQNVSKSIKQLEDDLNVKIFNRTRQGVVVTEKGKLVVAFAETQIEKLKDIKEQLALIQKEKISGMLNLCTMNSGSCMIVPEMLCEFYKAYPNVNLNITEAKIYGVMQKVIDESADIGIVTYSVVNDMIYPQVDGELKLFPLFSGKWHYWVSAYSKFAEKGWITFSEANKTSILVDDAIDVEYLVKLYELFGLKANLGHRSRNLHVLGKLIAEQQGVLPDILFGSGELLYGYALEGLNGVVSVPVTNCSGYAGVGYIIKKNRDKELLLNFTMEYLKELTEKENMA
ncbi:MAG: LysR family transcriptional regulator [Peptococcaceae bacterium]|nr:LysR family transcriptional regulator [Peptococcaceae bacterium]